jgi:small-conductance mechanosensitive channel
VGEVSRIGIRASVIRTADGSQVYVTNFSAGALTYQLRAWTDRNEDWAQLRSDLSVAVNEALAREKIAIA